MTSSAAVEEQELGAQGASAPRYNHHLPAQSSGVEYEIAKQLIQQSQGRRDGKDATMLGLNQGRRASVDFATMATPSNNHPRESGSHVHQTHNGRCSPLQDRLPEAQYAPLSIAPAMGQSCR